VRRQAILLAVFVFALSVAALPVHARTGSIQTADLSISNHTLTDANGGNLLPGDTVNVQVTVLNSGSTSASSVTLTDNLTNLVSPSAALVDGGACSCSTTTTSLTANLSSIGAGGSKTLTFSATVASMPSSSTASSNVSVSWVGGAPGASPTNDTQALTIHIPTAVGVVGFTAGRIAGGVRLSWRHATGVGALGFNVWQSRTSRGPYVRVNAALIAARAGGSSAPYRYLVAGASHWFRLEVVALDGSAPVFLSAHV
jgi:hypothetical protein